MSGSTRGRNGFIFALCIAIIAITTYPTLRQLVKYPAEVAESISELDSQSTIVASVDSSFCLLDVVDNFSMSIRFLRCNDVFLGGAWLTDLTDSVFRVFHLQTAVRFVVPLESKRALMIGLGIGSAVHNLQKQGASVDVVEIDSNVVDLAKEYFALNVSGSDVWIEDAAIWLEGTTAKQHRDSYDVIIHDVFSTGSNATAHLYTQQVFQQLDSLLTKNGVAIVNFMGFHVGPHSTTSAAIAKTLRSVFPMVRCQRDEDPFLEVHIPGNIVCFASHQPIAFTLPAILSPAAKAAEAEIGSIPWLYTKLDAWIVLPSDQEGTEAIQLLTVDLNLLASSPPPVHEFLRQQIQGYIPQWVWERTSIPMADN